MSSNQIQTQGKVDEKKIIRRIARLLAIAYLYSKSPTIIDRIVNSISKDVIVDSIYNAIRTIDIGTRSGDIYFDMKTNEDNKTRIYIYVKNDEEGKKPYKIAGSLPSENDLETFFDLVSKKTFYAKEAGAQGLVLAFRNSS